MSIISKMRRQKAVWWAQGGTDDYGNPTYSAAVEINCRWEDVIKEYIDSQGAKRLSSAVVYVDRDMKPGDILRLGTLASVTAPSAPKSNTGWAAVEAFHNLPNLKTTEFLKTCYL